MLSSKELNLGVAAIIALSALSCSPQASAIENPIQTAGASAEFPEKQGPQVLSQKRVKGIELEQLVIDLTRGTKRLGYSETTTNNKISAENLSAMDLMVDSVQLSVFADQCGAERTSDRYILRFVDQQTTPSRVRPFPIRTTFTPGLAIISINTGDIPAYVEEQLPEYELAPEHRSRALANLSMIVVNQFVISGFCSAADIALLNRTGKVTDRQISQSQALADTKAAIWRKQLLTGKTKPAVAFAPRSLPIY